MADNFSIAWRLVESQHSRSAFSGHGGLLASARFSTIGKKALYLASSPSLAALETRGFLGSTAVKKEFALFQVKIPSELSMVTLAVRDLPKHWDASPPQAETRKIGDDFISARRALMLRVPSVHLPLAAYEHDCNFLVNPEHPDFIKLIIGKPIEFYFDQRLK